MQSIFDWLPEVQLTLEEDRFTILLAFASLCILMVGLREITKRKSVGTLDDGEEFLM